MNDKYFFGFNYKHWSFASLAISFLIFCRCANAEAPKVSEMQCGETTVRIESYCKIGSIENQLGCSKQILSFKEKATDKKYSKLLQDEPDLLNSPISEWVCSQGKSGKYLEVMRCLGGNCEIGNAIEFEIWSLSGELLAPYDINFSRKIKKLGIVSPSEFKKLSLTK